jgi:transcriptional regulator with XRE-family HTH domain
MAKVAAVNPRARAEWAVSRGIKSGSRASIEFGKALRLVRGELTQDEIAAKCGVSGSIWNTWETGKGVPGEASWRLIKAGLGRSATERLMIAIDAAVAANPNAGVPLAAKKKAVAKTTAKVPGPPEPVEAETARNVVRGPDTDGVLVAVLGCGLPDRAKALLCAAVVAMAAGVDVEVEIRARV